MTECHPKQVKPATTNYQPELKYYIRASSKIEEKQQNQKLNWITGPENRYAKARQRSGQRLEPS